MHQGIQTFSELTAIDTHSKLVVKLSVRKHGHTVSKITVNGSLIDQEESIMHLDLLASISLMIDLIDFDEGTSGLEVGLTVNGYEVLPKYKHISSDGNCYIDKLGIWNFEIPSPFYKFYQKLSGESEILNFSVL